MLGKSIKNTNWGQLIRVTLLSLFVGIGSGILGAVMIENYLLSYAEKLDQASMPLRITQEKPRPLPGTYEEAVEKIRTQVEPALVRIYPISSENGSIENRVYGADEALASGIIVTSDGWVVTSGELSVDGTETLVAVVGREAYQINEAHYDEATNLLLIKIDGINLPVIAFGSSEYVREGDLAFVVPAREAIISSSIERIRDNNGIIHGSEALLRHFILSETVSSDAYASPVTNSAGELIGFVVPNSSIDGETDLVRPLHHILPAIESVLSEGEVERAYFGASIIDIVSAIGLTDKDTRGHNRGALIVQDPAGRYVSGIVPGSPADLGGLINDDIILEVNGKTVNGRSPFAEILLDYNPGDEINLKVDRDGEEIDVVVILGELE